jgi:hypothetical protein
MSRTTDVREPRFGHPSNITLKDVTRVNVCQKYIKYSRTFFSDEQEVMKCSPVSCRNIFTMSKQKHTAAPCLFWHGAFPCEMHESS